MWYFITVNSPYTLVDDITVSDTCTLVIEPGVIVIAISIVCLLMELLQAIGSVSDSIMINNFNIISMNNRNGSDSVNYVSFKSNSTSTLKLPIKITTVLIIQPLLLAPLQIQMIMYLILKTGNYCKGGLHHLVLLYQIILVIQVMEFLLMDLL